MKEKVAPGISATPVAVKVIGLFSASVTIGETYSNSVASLKEPSTFFMTYNFNSVGIVPPITGGLLGGRFDSNAKFKKAVTLAELDAFTLNLLPLGVRMLADTTVVDNVIKAFKSGPSGTSSYF